MTRAASPCIAIDCRMLGMSGIGVYLENIVPEVMRCLPLWRFRLIGDIEKIRALSLPPTVRLAVRACHAPIYSAREQLLLSIVSSGANLFWSPHYNIPLLTRMPLLVTVHDVAHLVLPEVTSCIVHRAYARLFFEVVRRKAKTILSVSQFTADEFVRIVGKPRGKMRVVHNGVDDAWFECFSSTNSSVDKDTRPYFVAVGNLKAHKRIDLLCRAFAAVKDLVPHNLVLVGKHEGFVTGGQSMQELIALAPGRIQCTGAVDAYRLRELVRGATALIFPSCYEGFGLPPLEAMAAGVPVIAADIPPVREVCREWITYFPVDDERALAGALMKKACNSSADLSPAARRHAEHYSWPTAGKLVAQEISELLR